MVISLAKVLKSIKLTYIEVIVDSHRDWNLDILTHMKNILPKKGICVDVMHEINEYQDFVKLDDIINKLSRKKRVKTVVLLCESHIIEALFNKIKENSICGMSWISIAPWEDGPIFARNWHMSCNNVFRIVPHRGKYTKFEDYFWNLTSNGDQDNGWLALFFQRYGQLKRSNETYILGTFKYLFYTSSIGFSLCNLYRIT